MLTRRGFLRGALGALALAMVPLGGMAAPRVRFERAAYTMSYEEAVRQALEKYREEIVENVFRKSAYLAKMQVRGVA